MIITIFKDKHIFATPSQPKTIQSQQKRKLKLLIRIMINRCTKDDEEISNDSYTTLN